MAFKKSSFQDTDKIILPEEKKQRFWLAVFGIVVLIIIVVLYFGFWHSSGLAPTNHSIATSTLETEKSLNQIDFNSAFINTSYFNNLEDNIALPSDVGDKGKRNPFLPYTVNSE